MLSLKRGRWIELLLLAAAAAGLSGAPVDGARAQAYPGKPIKFVVSFPAGSAGELINRVLAEKMQVTLGQPIIVDPRPGGGTLIGTRYVIAQPPDGYTIFQYSSSMSIKSAVANPPFDARRDLTQIAGIVANPAILAVNKDKVPVNSVPELIAFAKAHPGQLNFSNFGVGTTGHLTAVLFAQVTGIKVVHVPYNGPTASVAALASGDSDLTFDGKFQLSSNPDKIRMLAVSSAARSPVAPELPGMKEVGVPVDLVTVLSVAGPAGLPRPIVNTLNAAVNSALKEKSVIDAFANMHLLASGGTPEEITDQVNREIETMAKIIRDADLKIE
jgi:tripartite-type tricarboxylate transporter receptor subunit TctC